MFLIRYFQKNSNLFKICIKILIFLCFTAFLKHSFAWELHKEGLYIKCKQTVGKINCDYHSLNKILNNEIIAKANGARLKLSKVKNYSTHKASVALLFLVDTSDPNRQNVIEKNKQHIETLISSLGDNYKIGIASFDKSFKTESPITSKSYLLSEKIQSLKAEGKTTELYRSIIQAINYINDIKADRKHVVILSDGLAEDTAYFHFDVIKAAKNHSVIISAIGYPRSIALSVALQKLRRLTEESGGVYIETDHYHELENDKLKSLFSKLSYGGNFNIILEQVFRKNLSEIITLEFSSPHKKITINIPVDISNIKEAQTIKENINVNTKNNTEYSQKTSNPLLLKEKTKFNINGFWLWFIIFLIIVSLIILLILFTRKFYFQKPNVEKYENKIYAYLIAQNKKNDTYPITKNNWKIGRKKNNDLRLKHISVSRFHAEIHIYKNDVFDIVDMNSINGVYVDCEKVETRNLNEGDIIKIGKYSFKFTRSLLDDYVEENDHTVMQETQEP